jgi:hypothetical protein
LNLVGITFKNLLEIERQGAEIFAFEASRMTSEQNFPGDYTSAANQVIGAQFHGPVVFNTPENSRKHHFKPTQRNAKSDSWGRPQDVGSEISGSGLNEGFNWDGECRKLVLFNLLSNVWKIASDPSPLRNPMTGN